MCSHTSTTQIQLYSMVLYQHSKICFVITFCKSVEHMDGLAEPSSSIGWNLSALVAGRRDSTRPSAEYVPDDGGIDALNLASIQRKCERRQNHTFAKRMVKNNTGTTSFRRQ